MFIALMEFFIPRFITEDVIFYIDESDGVAYPAFPVSEYNDDSDPTPDMVITLRSFSWLWVAWKPKQIGEPVNWSSYIKAR